jgi:hypothetical protein
VTGNIAIGDRGVGTIMLSVIKLVTDVLIKCAIGPHIVNYQERYLLVLAFIPIKKAGCVLALLCVQIEYGWY